MTTAPITAEQAIAIGGKEWIRPGKHRVYFDDWHQYAGLEVNYYGTGNVSSALLDGELISNRWGREYLPGKVFWEDGKIWTNGVHSDLSGKIGPAIRKAIEEYEAEHGPVTE